MRDEDKLKKLLALSMLGSLAGGVNQTALSKVAEEYGLSVRLRSHAPSVEAALGRASEAASSAASAAYNRDSYDRTSEGYSRDYNRDRDYDRTSEGYSRDYNRD